MKRLFITGNGDTAGLRRTLFWAQDYFEKIEYFSNNTDGVAEVFKEFGVRFDWAVYVLGSVADGYSYPLQLLGNSKEVVFFQREGSIAVKGCYDFMHEKALEKDGPVDALPLLLMPPHEHCTWGEYWQEVHPGVIAELLKTPLVLTNSPIILRAVTANQLDEKRIQLTESEAAVVIDSEPGPPAGRVHESEYHLSTSKEKELCKFLPQ